MKHAILTVAAVLLALTALPALAADADLAGPDSVTPTLEELMTPAAAADTDVEGACDTPLLDADAVAACPHGAPTCSRDRDCDAYCGGVGFGVCQGHWTGCCICAG